MHCIILMNSVQSQITSVSILYSTVCSGASEIKHQRSAAGNSPVIGEFPAHKASNAENVPIWWRLHDTRYFKQSPIIQYEKLGQAIWLPVTTYRVAPIIGTQISMYPTKLFKWAVDDSELKKTTTLLCFYKFTMQGIISHYCLSF